MRILPLVLLAACLLFAGCSTGVVSKNPLSSPKAAIADPRLEGLWRARDGSCYEYFAFGNHSNRGDNLLLRFEKSGNQLGSSNSMKFFVTRTKAHSYLNMNHDYGRDGNEEKPSLNQDDYTFLEYYFSKRGDLVVSEPNDDLFKTAVKDGKLQGQVSDKDSWGPNPYLTDSSDHILTFIESSDPKEIFWPAYKFVRIGGP
jgi:hypothetical protein